MDVDVVGYAEDCIIRGVLVLAEPRLTEQLTRQEALHLGKATLQALDDGRTVDAGDLDVTRDDLCAISSPGPRGAQAQRIRTRQHPVVAEVGPYRVVGYLHASPTADPIAVARRRVVIPLTDARIAIGATREVVGTHEVLILNRDRIVRIEPAEATDLDLAAEVEIPVAVDPLAKDRTGELYMD